MKKGVWLGLGFAVFVGFTTYSLLTGAKYECEVCILYNDIRVCQKVNGMDKMDTIQMGVSTACGGAANGRTETIDCGQTPPTKVICKDI